MNYQDITINGLWKNNPALVQLLGLCPLLAMTGSAVNSLGMGAATIFVLITSNITVAMVRNVIPNSIRLPVFVMIIAAFVTTIEMLMQAFSYELYTVLGVFLPLITTNCAILGRAEAFACKNSIIKSAYDGLMMGLGFAIVMFMLGFLREFFGSGTIFADMHLLFGEHASSWKITIPNYPQFLYVILPPGSFIFAGFMIAVKNIIQKQFIDNRAVPVKATAPDAAVATS